MGYSFKATSLPRAAASLSSSSLLTRAMIPVSERCKRALPLSWASLLATSCFCKPFVQPYGPSTGTIAEGKLRSGIMSLTHALCHDLGAPPRLDVGPIVFVVDDDISVRESLELLIRCEGWQPETFSSGQEFLTRPRALVPSCMVLDFSLPGLNGLELQKRVAVERAAMPIIFISGYGDVPMTVQAMKAGAVEFLTKPFSEEALLSAIRAALERSRVALGREAEIRSLRDRYASLSRRERQV